MSSAHKEAKTWGVRTDDFDLHKIREDILYEAYILKMSLEEASKIIVPVSKKLEDWLPKHPAADVAELNSFLAQELQNYSDDLAFVYRNRGKII